jgi:hypothetical protein
MQMDDWQPVWSFDFPREHKTGTTPADAAMKANRFWWREQNKSLKQDLPEPVIPRIRVWATSPLCRLRKYGVLLSVSSAACGFLLMPISIPG